MIKLGRLTKAVTRQWLVGFIPAMIFLFSCVPNKEFKARIPGTEDDTFLSISSSSTYINSSNVNNYPISGNCSDEGNPVVVQAVDVNGMIRSPNGTIVCSGGRWATGAGKELDLTLFAQGAVTIRANHSDKIGQSRTATWSTRKDTINPTVTNVTSSTANGIYGVAQTVQIEIQFSESVVLTGSSILLLNASLNSKAIYISGSGTSNLIFRYTVSFLDNTADLDYSSINALGGMFRDLAGNSFINAGALPAVGGAGSLGGNKSIIIDTGAPTITAITTTATPSENRNQGDVIHIYVTPSEPVAWNVSGGLPRLELNVTPDTRYAVLSPTTSTSVSLDFVYTVQVEDYIPRLEYASVNALTLQGGTLRDIGGNDLLLTLPALSTSGLYTSNIPINARVARVTRGYISEIDGTYILGQNINIFLETSRDIFVTGLPYLELKVSDGVFTTATASYVGGSGTSLLQFRYTVQEGDISLGESLSYIENDLTTPANGPLKLNGGTMMTDNGETISLLLPPPTSSSALDFLRNVDVDGDIPRMIRAYTTTATSSLVGIGDTVSVIAQFDQSVSIAGLPAIYVNANPTITATYVSGSGSDTIVFNYTAQEGDVIVGAQSPYLDIDTSSSSLFYLPALAAITDVSGNGAYTLYSGTTPTEIRNKLITIDTVRPVINTIITTDQGTKIMGDLVTIEITSTATPLYATGTPSLLINVFNGVTTSKYVECSYIHVNPLTTFTCPYTVAKGDYNNGVDNLDYVGSNPLINVGDLYGNLLGGFPTPGNLGSLSNPVSLQIPVVIDGKIPVVTNITSPNIDGNYLVGDVISFRISFDDTVVVNTVSGSPYLTLDTNPDPTLCGTASYIGGSGTNILHFEYTVKEGDSTSHRSNQELDYLATSSLTFNGSAMRDINGNQLDSNDLALYLPGAGAVGAGSLSVNKNITIDALRPVVTQVTSTIANAKYGPNSDVGAGTGVIPLTLVFSEDVTVIGNPALLLNTNGVTRRAIYDHAENSNTLIFNYQIQSGDRIGTDPIRCVSEFNYSECDLNYTSTSALDANGGDIRDSSSNSLFTAPAPADGYLPDTETGFSLKFLKDIKIDTFSPTVVEIRPAGATTGATQTYIAGQTVNLEMEFDEEVNISSGTLGLRLSNGATASYVSGANSKVLTFAYTVLADDVADPLGFSMINPLTISGTHAIYDLAGNYLDYTTFDPGGQIANDPIVINGLVPKVSSVTLISTASMISIDNGYDVVLDIGFDKTISVTGNPILYLNVGGTNSTGVANMISTTATSARFSYSVREGDGEGNAGDGQTISISSSSALVANNGINGTIRDVYGVNNANLSITDLNIASKIDGLRPSITTINASPSITSPNRLYLGQNVDITISFHEAIVVTGAVTLNLNIGLTGKAVNCVIHPSDNHSIICTYTVGVNDQIITGVYYPYLSYYDEDALVGDIRDQNGNLANLKLTRPFMPNNMVIDGTTAAVSLVTSDNANGIYVLGNVIGIKIDFSHDLILSSDASPQLTLVTNTVPNPDSTRVIDCIQDISDDSILLCNYTVSAGDFNADLNYSATSSLTLLSGSITTIYNSQILTASLVLPEINSQTSLAGQKDLYVSTIPPTIVDIDAGSGYQTSAYYSTGAVIPIEITFSASMQVPVGGTTTLGLNISGIEKEISCTRHTTIYTKFVCNYSVVSGDSASPLDCYGAANCTLHTNGATMIDMGGNVMTNFLFNKPTTLAGRNLIIDTTIPDVSINTPGMFSYIKSTQGTDIAETFDLTGTCTDPPGGASTVTIRITDGVSNTQTISTNCVAGIWNYSVETLDSYPDGIVVVTATQSDSANNQSIVATKIFQKSVAMYPGEDHNFSIFMDRILKWGDNTNYQLGDSTNISKSYPKSDLSLEGATQIASGGDHTCAILSGQVYCFGNNQKSGSDCGQLGINTNEPYRSALTTAVVNSGGIALTNIKQIALGKYFSCALTDSGNVYCWGDNTYGQLGINSAATYRLYASLIDPSVLSNVDAIYTGAEHACATAKGYLYCWGRNNYGQVGIGSNGNYQTEPILITGLSTSAKQYLMALGRNHTCALYDGGVQCWGANNYGQLGNGTDGATVKNRPVIGEFASGLSSGSGVIQITSGDEHTCVLQSGGVKCFGRNTEGQLGDSSNVYKNVPTSVTGFTAGNMAQGVFAGGNHTCLISNGGVRCFGKNNYYQLGNGQTTNRNTPDYTHLMSGLKISAGDQHTCVDLKSGTFCFGTGSFGRLGNGSAADSTNPVAVTLSASATIKNISTGNEFSCAASNNEAWCWGSNLLGQLGISLATQASSTPVAVKNSGSTNLQRVSNVSSGFDHTCAKVGDEIMCWGEGSSGQLGDNLATSSNIPKTVLRGAANLSTIGTIYGYAVGGNYSCAILGSTKQTYCWGDNTVNPQALYAVPVAGANNADSISVGGSHACIVVNEGVRCWGSDTDGKLGNNSAVGNSTIPVIVDVDAVDTALTQVIQVVSGDKHNCALQISGAVKCWGNNDYGQLGTATGVTTSSPYAIDVDGLGSGSGVIALTAGRNHTCALLKNGAKCWGNNDLGQLGSTTSPNLQSEIPVSVDSISY